MAKPKRALCPPLLSILLACLLLAPLWANEARAAEAPVLRLGPAGESFHLGGPHMEYLVDIRGELTLSEVSDPAGGHRFRPVRGQVLSLGPTRATVWLRCRLMAPPQGERQWLLDVDRPPVIQMTLYTPLPEGGWRQESAFGREGPGGGKALVFDLRLPPGQALTCYLKVQSDYTALFLPLTVMTREHYTWLSRMRMYGFGTYLGLSLAMILLNFFLFFALKDLGRLYYVLFAGAMLLMLMEIYGLAPELLFPGHGLVPETPAWSHRFSIFFMGLTMLFGCQFARTFLLTRSRAPVMDRILLTLMLLALVQVLLAPVAGHLFLNLLGSGLALLNLAALAPAGVLALVRGFRPARFFVVAFSILGLSGMAHTLTWLGWLPYSEVGWYGLQVASGLELIILSLALTDRVRLMSLEREALKQSEARYMQQAITDDLTGLKNSGYFRNQIGAELRRARALGQPLALLMIDVDDFKVFNDSFGHPAGDKVLTRLGRIIQDSVRDGDLACRYGGEEFAVILPGADGAKAAEVAQRIAAACRRQVFSPRAGQERRITVSIGVAQSIPGQEPAGLIDQADRALYEAKRQGKDRVALAGQDAGYFPAWG